MQATTEQLLWMYEKMVEIREYEETMVKVYLEGKLPPKIQKGLAFDIGAGPVPGEMHLAAGQEPVAVGVCAHLRRDDTVVGAHRPHHFAIAKNVDLNAMTAEMYGKATGLGRGKGGHMHLFDPAVKFSCSGIVGAGAPQACGAALAARKLGTDAVAVFEAAGEAVARARRGEGPTLIEVKTDRYYGHFQGDPETYRPKGEAKALRQHDPIPALGALLRSRDLLDDESDAALRTRVSARVQAAYDFGRNSPYPEPQDALLHVFAD